MISSMKTKSRDGAQFGRVHWKRESFDSSSSVASSTTSCSDIDDKKELVYVRDDVYAWLPAEVQSLTSDGLSTEVKIIIPDDWAETTILYDKSSIKELEYKMDPNCVGKSNTISSPQFGKGPNCRIKVDHAPKRRIYNDEKNKEGRSIADGIMRSIVLQDYPNGALPSQNIERQTRRLSMSGNSRNNSDSNTLMNARDMTDLPHLHEAAVLYNLKLRNKMMMPYTRVGDIMVAVNPFQWIDGLYSNENQASYAQYLIWGIRDVGHSTRVLSSPKQDGSAYMNSSMASLSNNDSSTKHQPMAYTSYYSKLGLEPHVFETASLAYSGLSSAQQNQTILVSGESGAGKTETVKIVMTNLARLEQTRPSYTPKHEKAKGRDDRRREEAQGIVRRVLESNPLFESFGNAKVSIAFYWFIET